jgi:CDP-diglyceride synthetase
MKEIIQKIEKILPLTVALAGGLLAYSCLRDLGKYKYDFVELLFFGVSFGGLSIWLAIEAIKETRNAGWLASSGILFYCMFRHLAPLFSDIYYYIYNKFGYLSLVMSHDSLTYFIMAILFAVTGWSCLKASNRTHNQEDTPA